MGRCRAARSGVPDDELRALWTCDTRIVLAANGDKIKMSPIEGAFLKLLILTGKRTD